MGATSNPRRIAESLKELEVHVVWIREALERQEGRAAEDRVQVQAHIDQDQAQFSALSVKINRLFGGLTLLGFLLGIGAPWLLGLLGP